MIDSADVGMGGVDPRVARSRAVIIEATLELLAERGVEATTIEAICERSGVAKTTLYRQWPSKGELMVSALDSLAELLPDPDTGTFERDLVMLAEGLAHGLGSGPWSALLLSIIDAAQRDPSLAEIASRFTASRHLTVRSVIAQARERGEVRSDLEDDDIIELIAGPLFYRLLVTGDEVSPDHARRLARLVADLASDGAGV